MLPARHRPGRPPGLLICVAAVAMLALSCAGDGEPQSATTPSTAAATNSTTVPDPAPFVERGPSDVGVLTLALDDGRRVVVWYPAEAAAVAGAPQERFDIASLLTPELQAMIPAGKRPIYEIEARPGAPADATDAPRPVVLFSHGFAGFPEQSVDLTTHLASHGFVVVAPDHVERSLSGLLGTAARGVKARKDTEVLGAALDLALADGKRSGSPLKDLIDGENVAVVGHSAGAGAAYQTASSDPRIDAFISYSVATGSAAEGEPEPLPPDVPGMVMLGTADGIIPADDSRKVYRNMNEPKYLVEIGGAGHLVFSDICLIAKEQGGIVGIARSIKLPIPEELFELGTDGCADKDLDPTEAFPAINDLSVAFLRRYLGVDDDPGTLAPAVAEAAAFDGLDLRLRAAP